LRTRAHGAPFHATTREVGPAGLRRRCWLVSSLPDATHHLVGNCPRRPSCGPICYALTIIATFGTARSQANPAV